MSIYWQRARSDFVEYAQSKQFCQDYRKSILRYLDRNVTIISKPMGIIRIFANTKKGRRNLRLALRNLINYYEATGFDKDFLDRLREAMPHCDSGVDLRVPNEDDVIHSLQKLEKVLREIQGALQPSSGLGFTTS